MLADFKFSVPGHWVKTLWALLIVLLLSLSIFHEIWSAMINTWANSKTYTHGYVVAPISFWLIWNKRHQYSRLHPQISWAALIAVFLAGFIWLLAALSQVLVVQQFAVVAMLLAGIWLLIGNHVTTSILFPLVFLFFMVPVGDQLITPLMDFTATFAVTMLRLTGIPVYREGTFFTLTSGNWSVVEACSGINYLIASLTLGFVYAYLNYTRYWKRALFMLLSLVVPIIANGFRAYMIVMIGHLSGMKLAVGVDHIIYGGIFFGLVMLILFYLGSFWRDADEAADVTEPQSHAENEVDGSKNHAHWLAVLCVGVNFLLWPQMTAWLVQQQTGAGLPDYLLQSRVSDWQLTNEPNWGWEPDYRRAVAKKAIYYTDGNRTIGVYHASFGKEEQGAELVSWQNVLVHGDIDKAWRIIGHSSLSLAKLSAKESVLNKANQDLLVLEWYQVGNHYTTQDYSAKWHQLWKRLTGNSKPELKVLVWTDTLHEDHAQARAALTAFTQKWFEQTADKD